MKKVLALVLALAMICSFAACGDAKQEEAPAKNELAEYLENGFVINGSSADTENGYVALLVKDTGDYNFDYSQLYKVQIPLTEKEYNELDMIEWDDEEKKNEYLFALDDVVISDISDRVPSQEEINSLVGKTFGDLEDMGFYNSGWVEEEEGQGYYFYYDGPTFYGKFTVPEDQKVTNMDDMSPNDIRELVIDSVEFLGVSFDIVYAE